MFLRIFVTLFFVFLVTEATATTNYNLRVEVQPTNRRIHVNGTISGFETNKPFYLNKDFSIHTLRSQGKDLSFDFKADSGAPAIVREAVYRIKPIGTVNGQVDISYSGPIDRWMSEVNTISEKLVELAVYSGWFPTDFSFKDITYTVTLAIPREFIVVAGGDVVSTFENASSKEVKIQSVGPGFDIPLIASPLFKKKSIMTNGRTLEIYYSSLDESLLERRLESVQLALHQYERWFGKALSTGGMRFVYSPRDGWGYSRMPLFVVSEKRAKNWLAEDFGEAKDFQGNVHELAHFWWLLANADSNDDWINEGLAEFSAFSIASLKFGPEYREFMLKEYRQGISRLQADEALPINKTPSDSPQRYVNRYQKTTLMFAKLADVYGNEKLFEFLRKFHSLFARSKNATTEQFLKLMKSELGSEAHDYFKDRLATAKWSEQCAGAHEVCLPKKPLVRLALTELKGIGLKNESLPDRSIQVSNEPFPERKLEALKRLIQSFNDQRNDLLEEVFSPLYPGRTIDVQVIATTGIPAPYDAWTAKYKGKFAIFFNLSQWNEDSLERSGLGVIKHEVSHVLAEPFIKTPSKADRSAWLRHLVLDEGIAHFFGYNPEKRSSLISGKSQNWEKAESKLSQALESLKDSQMSEQEKDLLVKQANTGSFWEKYGAISGMFRAASLYEREGAQGLRAAIRANSLDFLPENKSRLSKMNPKRQNSR